MAISSWVDACAVTPLPFEDYPSTLACQTGPRNQAPGKADWGTIGNNIHTDCWFIDVEIEMVVKSQPCHYVWKKLAFVKSSHILCLLCSLWLSFYGYQQCL